MRVILLSPTLNQPFRMGGSSWKGTFPHGTFRLACVRQRQNPNSNPKVSVDLPGMQSIGLIPRKLYAVSQRKNHQRHHSKRSPSTFFSNGMMTYFAKDTEICIIQALDLTTDLATSRRDFSWYTSLFVTSLSSVLLCFFPNETQNNFPRNDDSCALTTEPTYVNQ